MSWEFFGLWAIAGALVYLSGFVTAVIFKPWYDKQAESVENLTAEEAQSLSEIFGSIAKRLKTPGK